MPAVEPAATGQPDMYDVTMGAVPETAEEARRLTREAMVLWGLEEQAEVAALLISELVTNAITHTPSSTVRVRVTRLTAQRVRLAAVDRAPPLCQSGARRAYRTIH